VIRIAAVGGMFVNAHLLDLQLKQFWIESSLRHFQV